MCGGIKFNFFLHISPLARKNSGYFRLFHVSGVVSGLLLASGGRVSPVFLIDGVMV